VATNYYWDFGDGTTATGQNAIHNYSDTGTYTVTLIVISEGGCSSTTTQTITVNQTATGITTLNNKAAINIWSNENKVYIDFSQMAKTDATIAIYNVLGQELVNEKFARSIIYNKAILNTEATYVIVKVKNGDVVITKKVFIANVK
jgi:PKD repeat protein